MRAALWGLLALGCAAELPAPVPGVALGLFASDPGFDYATLIDEIARYRASAVLVVVPLAQDDVTDAAPRPVVAPAALARALAHARRAGLAVTLMPIIDVARRGPGRWRGVLAPPEPGRWWAAYRAELLALADVARAAGVHRLVIGSELASLEGDAAWRPLIAAIRPRFPGRLTYSANWDRYAEVPFWDALDEVAVSAWFPAPVDAPLAAAHRFAAERGRPLVLTELGYPALASAAEAPWDQHTGAAPDARLQARLLAEGLAAADAAGATEVFVWNWFGPGGSGDVGFSPRGKPAAGIMARAFAGWARRGPRQAGSPSL
ncbi:MAG: hypothetical protein H6706_13985 [Myxococcales bacterium]|nr:hypothetical protein [Myxococcales bacterium]